jgi:anti-anti-sigma factor
MVLPWCVLASWAFKSYSGNGDVTILDREGRAVIGVDNDLLNSHLRKLVNEGARKLLLNLVDVTQVDSSSIGTIVGTYVSLRRQGGSLKLLRPRVGCGRCWDWFAC